MTTDAGDKVTLTLNNALPGHGTGSLNCTGTTTATVAGGYATFTGCSITTVGNYQLTATDIVHTIAAVNSNRLTVEGASQLAFTAQPSADPSEAAGVAFTTQPVVAEEDANGDIVTSDSGNTVTLSLANFVGHGTGALTCTGNATLKATVTAGYANSAAVPSVPAATTRFTRLTVPAESPPRPGRSSQLPVYRPNSPSRPSQVPVVVSDLAPRPRALRSTRSRLLPSRTPTATS